MAKKGQLSELQKRFADYYIELGIAKEAAIKAGYSPKSAKFQGSRNLTNPLIMAYIRERMATKDDERIASQDEVLEFLTGVMRGEVTEQVPLLDGDGYQRLAKLDAAQPKDRIKAAELLGKRHAMWTEKNQNSGEVTIRVVNNLEDDE